MIEVTKTRKRVPRVKQDPAVSTNPDALLTVETVAELIACKPDTLRKWVSAGRFPQPLHMGRAIRWRAQVVNEWMRSRASAVSPEA
jgi:excisionase family DNA binding protein